MKLKAMTVGAVALGVLILNLNLTANASPNGPWWDPNNDPSQGQLSAWEDSQDNISVYTIAVNEDNGSIEVFSDTNIDTTNLRECNDCTINNGLIYCDGHPIRDDEVCPGKPWDPQP